jgi:glycosyltransferase involved in cell wall biosynthesis
MPCYNSGAYIREAVDSVLSQTFQDLELLIVDSGSTDQYTIETIDELAALVHPKVKILRRTQQHLPGSNRNYGIERASGEFILCFDADDIIEPTFVEEALFVSCCADYGLVGTSCRIFGMREQAHRLITYPTLEQVANGNAFVVCTVFRKDLWTKLGGFRDTGLGRNHVPEDWDFFVRAVAAGAKAYNRPGYGLRYRRHHNSLTMQPDNISFDEMRRRIRARHRFKLWKNKLMRKRSVASSLRRDGWRRLLGAQEFQNIRLVVLPDKLNDAFIEGLNDAIGASDGEIVFVSTQQIDLSMSQENPEPAYPQGLKIGSSNTFCLPNFLDNKELWLEFIHYLIRSRSIREIFYGQNLFSIEQFPELSAMLPDCCFNYISNHRTPMSGTQTVGSG